MSWIKDITPGSKAPDPLVGGGFAGGTLIATTRGEVPVEQLVPGDDIVTTSGGTRRLQAIEDVSARQAVFIPADAFADDVPSQPLVIAEDQEIAFTIIDDVLVRANDLVPGSTLVRAPFEATMWRLTLEKSGIVSASGLRVSVGGRNEARALDLSDEDTIIEAVRWRLNTRAHLLGWELNGAVPPSLSAFVDDVELRPTIKNGMFRFSIAGGAGTIILASPSSIPIFYLDSTDNRSLGAAIRSMRIIDGFEERSFDLANPPAGCGFHGWEGSHLWTNGRVVLPKDFWGDFQDGFYLVVEVCDFNFPRFVMPTA